MNKTIIQITSGRGPAECCWVVAQLLRVILEEAKKKGLEAFILNKVKGDKNQTLASATIQLEGNKQVLKSFLNSWTGSIQWIGKSPFRKYHKRKNWFVGVQELDLTKETLAIDDKLIKYAAIRSGGPGGQHVNKVSTAIRATYIPSGFSVLASESRSQLQNKKNAKERLINLLKAKQFETFKESVKANWQNHNELERGNPVRVFKGSFFILETK